MTSRLLCGPVALAAALSGPALADELRVGDDALGQPTADQRGVLAAVSVEAAYLERDVYGIVSPSGGYLSPPFELQLTLPVELLLIDLAPPSRQQALLGVLRARTYLEDGALGLPVLSKVLTRLRVGRPDELLHLRGGAIHHSLGHGSVVWRYASTPDIDRRQAGAVLRLGNDVVGVEALVGNVLAPQRVSAARTYLRPLLLFVHTPGLLQTIGERIALGLGYAADFTAPLDPGAIAADGSYRADGATAALVHAFADAELLLLDWTGLSVALYGDGGLRYGAARRLGGGGELGVMAGGRLFASGLSLRLGLRLAGARFRPAEFDAYYEVERVTTFAHGVPKASEEPAPGVAGVAEVALSVSRWVRLRAQLDDAPGPDNSNALAGIDVSAGPVRAAAALAQRGFEGHEAMLTLGAHTVGLAELRVETVGPLALVGRYWRTLRRQDGTARMDNDLVLGIEAGWLLR